MNKRPTQEQIDFIRSSNGSEREIKKATGLSLSVIRYFKGTEKPKKKINPRSKKLTAGMIQYTKVKQEFMRDNPACQICGNTEMLSIHHIAGRAGRNLCDKDNFLVACLGGSYHLSDQHEESNKRDGCHPWIEANLGLAKKLGYSKSKKT